MRLDCSPGRINETLPVDIICLFSEENNTRIPNSRRDTLFLCMFDSYYFYDLSSIHDFDFNKHINGLEFPVLLIVFRRRSYPLHTSRK